MIRDSSIAHIGSKLHDFDHNSIILEEEQSNLDSPSRKIGNANYSS